MRALQAACSSGEREHAAQSRKRDAGLRTGWPAQLLPRAGKPTGQPAAPPATCCPSSRLANAGASEGQQHNLLAMLVGQNSSDITYTSQLPPTWRPSSNCAICFSLSMAVRRVR